MTIDLTTLDAHAQPSDRLRAAWKSYSRTDHSALQNHPDIDDVHTQGDEGPFKLTGHIPKEKLLSSFQAIEGEAWDKDQIVQDAPIYCHPLLPSTSINRAHSYFIAN